MSDIRNWHYIDGPRRVGPFDDLEWAGLVRDGTVGPETRVWNEELSGWAPYASVAERFPLPELPEADEDEASLAEEPPPLPTSQEGNLADTMMTPEAALAFEQRVTAQEYHASGRSCLRRAWAIYREQMVSLSGVAMLTWLIVSIGSSLPSLLATVMPLGLNGVFQGGMYAAFIKALRGERAGAADLFSGFRKGIFSNLVMRTLIGSMVLYACIFTAVLVLQMMGLKLEEAKDPATVMARAEAFFSALDPMGLAVVALLLLVCLLPAFFFGVCWIFSVPLIRDRGLPWPVALRVSRRKVQQHPVRILRALASMLLLSLAPTFGAMVIAGAISASLVPVAMLLVSILFSMPLFVGGLMALYESVFPRAVCPAPVPEPEGAPR